MIDFAYTAKTAAGESASGAISADSAAHARQLLRAEGYFPMAIRTRALEKRQKEQTKKRSSRTRGVRKDDLLMLTSQLSIMTRSGVDLADALKGVAEECRNSGLQKVLRQVHDDVSAGETVSAALGKHVGIFGETYVVAIQAAEASEIGRAHV